MPAIWYTQALTKGGMEMSKNLSANEHVQQGNFKKLYNKQYGDIVSLNKTSYTPEQLFNFAVAYFTWAEENSLKAAETASFQGDVSESLVHKPRVFTMTGLALFVGCSTQQFIKWRRLEGYSEVMDFIDTVVFEQKFQLAATGILNSTFIGKEMGIDKPTTINVETSASAQASNTQEGMQAAVESVLDKLNM